MRHPAARSWIHALCLVILVAGLAVCGCQAIKRGLSANLGHWNMLEQNALEDPIKAVGGDGIVFSPNQDMAPMNRKQLAAADPSREQSRRHLLQQRD